MLTALVREDNQITQPNHSSPDTTEAARALLRTLDDPTAADPSVDSDLPQTEPSSDPVDKSASNSRHPSSNETFILQTSMEDSNFVFDEISQEEHSISADETSTARPRTKSDADSDALIRAYCTTMAELTRMQRTRMAALKAKAARQRAELPRSSSNRGESIQSESDLRERLAAILTELERRARNQHSSSAEPPADQRDKRTKPEWYHPSCSKVFVDLQLNCNESPRLIVNNADDSQ